MGLIRVLVTALALAIAGAVMAPGALAAEFTAQDNTYDEVYSGSVAVGDEIILMEAGKIECATSYAGAIGAKTTELGATPSYTECKAFGFTSATVDNQGCGFVFSISEKLEDHSYRGPMEISCATGKTIVVTANTCEAEIGPQGGLENVDYVVNTGSPNDLSFIYTVTKLAYTVTKDGFLCPFKGTGSKTDGTIVSSEPLTITSGGGMDIG